MAELLKNLYNKKFISNLSKDFKKVYPTFDCEKFSSNVFSKGWKDKELKERMRHISHALSFVLPADFPEAVKILEKLSSKISCQSFELMIIPDYIEVYGQDFWKESLEGLEKTTLIASGEFAVRRFILKDSKKMIKTMINWSKHKNLHVRRLASEGSRPRLPWAMALPEFKNDPSPILPILENLKSDPELYVRRSVANNLNDISKNHPETVIKILNKWNKIKTPEMKWLIKHALRTLEKTGDPNALAILGYSSTIKVKAEHFKLKKKKIKMGEKLEFSLRLSSLEKSMQNIIVDFLIFHMKANGKLSPKIFKWTKKKINSLTPLELSKVHFFKEISTRKYYTGKHEIHIQVNGKIVAKDDFILIN